MTTNILQNIRIYIEVFTCFREKVPVIAPVIEPIVMPTTMTSATIDAAKRRQLPAWIREGKYE